MKALHARNLAGRTWRLIMLPVAGLLTGLVVAVIVTFLMTPTYKATASVIVLPQPNAVTQQVQLSDVSLAQTLVSSVALLAKSHRDVEQAVAKTVGVGDAEVTGHLNGVPQLGIQIVTVEATADTPAKASALADAATTAIADRATELKLGGSTVAVKPLDTATPPTTPVTPRPALNYALGMLVGLLLGIGAITLRSRLGDRFPRAADMEAELGLPVLGTIERTLRRLRGTGAHDLYESTDIGAAVDGLVASLSVLMPQHEGRRIIVTSVSVDDSAALVAAVLAVGLRNPRHGTTVLEGMLNQPDVHRYFPSYKGESADEEIGSTVAPRDRPHRGAPTLLSLGAEGVQPGREPRFEQVGLLIDKLVANGDDVVVRAPSVLAGRGLAVLATHADAVLLVVDTDTTSRADAHRAASLVQHLHVPLAGIVATGAAAADDAPPTGPDTSSTR